MADIPGITRTQPNAVHQKYLNALQQASAPFSSLPAIERLAIAAQFVGGIILELPTGRYDPQEVLHSVVANVTLGNQSADALAQPQNGGLQ